ncbi:MAG: PAS domain-containing protein [Bacteroidota bacterium]
MAFQFVYANERAAQILGTEPESLTGEALSAVKPDVYRGETTLPKVLLRVLESGKAGYISSSHLIAEPTTDKLHIIKINSLAENHLCLTFQAAESMSAPSLAVDVQNRMLLQGQELAEMCSWSVDPASGKTAFTSLYAKIHHFQEEELTPYNATDKCVERIHPDDQRRMRQFRQTPTEQYPITTEYRFRVGEGKYIWLEDTLSAKLENGRVVGLTRDITQKKKQEKLLIGYQQKLEALNQQLQETLGFQERILDTTPDVIYIYDLLNQRNVFSNKSIFQELGYSEDEIQEMGDQLFINLAHPDDLSRIIHHHSEVLPHLAEGETARLVYRMKQNGTENFVWLESLERSFERDDTGKVVSIAGIARNITEEKEAQNKLREANKDLEKSHHFQQKVMDTTPDIIHVHNLHTNQLIFTNQALYEELGYTQAEIQALGDELVVKLVHPEDLEIVVAHNEVVIPSLKDGEVAKLEVRMLHNRTQEYVWFGATETIFERNMEGVVESTIGITRNIHNEKIAKDQLETTNSQLEEALYLQQKILSTSPEIILIYDLQEQKTIFTNKPVFEVLGYTQEEIAQMKGEVVATLTHPDDLVSSLHFYKKVLPELTQHEKAHYLRKLVSKKGKTIWLSTTYSAFEQDEVGKTIKVIAIAVDVTGAKEEEALKEEANKELEELVYFVSHNLRAPVRHMESYSGFIKKEGWDSLNAVNQERLGKVIMASTRMGSMVDDLLVYTKSRNSTFKKAEVNTHELVLDILDQYKQEQPDRNIAWNLGALPPVWADHGQLWQVWENLIENAIKYSARKDKTIITIEAKEGDHETIFAIHDNGEGFDESIADKLFIPFQRLHKMSEFPGNGLGLASVARFIKLHKGRIWAKSESGKGASFYFSIPNQKS